MPPWRSSRSASPGIAKLQAGGWRARGVLLVSAIAIVGVFLAAEATVRLLGIQPSEPRAIANSDFDGIRVDPALGWLLRPGFQGKWPLGGFTVAADERGFRSAGDQGVPSSSCRVAFVGDSCTFGWGMETRDTFVAQLADAQRAAGRPACEMMNAAFPGQSAVTGVYILRERVLPYRPSVVVIAFTAHNAFRFTLVSDANRLRLATLRRWVARSQLVRLVAARFAPSGPMIDARHAAIAGAHPVLGDVRRVADAQEYGDALRTMAGEARDAGAVPLVLLLPRRSSISTDDAGEDAALSAQSLPPRATAGAAPTQGEALAVQFSCLDHRALPEPVRTLYEQRDGWRPVYPRRQATAALLRDGANAFVDADYGRAIERFSAALEQEPDSPLAHYDLGVAQLVSTGYRQGMQALDDADRLACSAFLHYSVTAWRVAVELNLPVVDITLFFQAHDGTVLYLDSAHPNVTGHEIIARALHSALEPYRHTDASAASPVGAR